MKGTRVARLVLAAMVVLTSFVGAAAAAQSASGAPVAEDGGYRFDIGGNGPSMTVWLHLDLFTNLGAAGDFGFSAVGTAMDTRIVVVDIQLQFEGVGDLGGFLSNPFSRFSVVAEWEVNLPFLSAGPAAGEDFSYEDNRTINGSSG